MKMQFITAVKGMGKGKGKGIWFIVLYSPKCSHNLPPLSMAGSDT